MISFFKKFIYWSFGMRRLLGIRFLSLLKSSHFIRAGLGVVRLVEPCCCRASKSIASDIFLGGSERSRAEVGGVTSRAKDSGHYTFSRCRLPLSGVPLWRSHPVVHGRHCRSRRRDRGMSSIHAWPIWNCDSFGVIRLYFVSVFSAVLTSPSWSKCQNLPLSLSFSFF